MAGARKHTDAARTLLSENHRDTDRRATGKITGQARGLPNRLEGSPNSPAGQEKHRNLTGPRRFSGVIPERLTRMSRKTPVPSACNR